MTRMPRESRLDRTLALVRDGYAFLPERFRRYGTDAFETRILGRRTVCLHGPDAARLFYDPRRFERRDAVPRRIRRTLLGDGGVHSLDGTTHAARKRLFMQLMTPPRIDELVRLFEREWLRAARHWAASGCSVLFDEARRILCRAVCAWSGVPLPEADTDVRASDLSAMVDAFGAAGPRHWRGRLARRRSEAWIQGIVEDVRAGRLDPPDGSALRQIAWHRDDSKHLLAPRVAAVEVLNVLRPTVAVASFVTFEALALHEHPEWRSRIAADTNGDEVELFVQEVRRLAPFVPFVGARVRTPFEWRGYRFERGRLVLLDIFGALHDENLWPGADKFDPERFRGRTESGFDLIPQGGGDHFRDHRCAGEWATIALMTSAARLLADRSVEAGFSALPEQDLRVSLRRIPARPASGFMMGPAGGAPAAEGPLLGIYLNDHLAGASVAARLARRLERSSADSWLHEPLSRLAHELADDRAALVGLMTELRLPVRRYKVALAAVGELAGRLKPNGRVITRSPLSPVVELEGLRLAIEAKAACWRTLRMVGATRGRPEPRRLDELMERAHRQIAVVEALRERAVANAVGNEERV